MHVTHIECLCRNLYRNQGGTTGNCSSLLGWAFFVSLFPGKAAYSGFRDKSCRRAGKEEKR